MVAAILPLQMFGAAASAQPLNSPNLADLKTAYESIRAQVHQLYDGLDAIERHVDKSAFELTELSRVLGPDPQAMFAFVRDRIGFQPYVGMLRGAKGTLLSRTGNALDRSLMLAALLKQNGFDAWIARGNLSPSLATKLAERVFEPPPVMPAAVADPAALLTDLLPAASLSGDAVADNLQKVVATNAALSATVQAQARALSDSLSAALAAADVPLDLTTPFATLSEECEDHFWVQYRDSSGAPVDLDPAFSDAQPGETFAIAVTTMAADAIPSELMHRLIVKLSLRVLTHGTPSDVVLIDQDFPVALAAGVGIAIGNQPIPAIQTSLLAGTSRQDALAQVAEYLPVLRVGDQLVVGKSFDVQGSIYDNLPRTDAGNAERARHQNEMAIGGATGRLGDIFAEDEQSVAQVGLLGEWVEFKLVAPSLRGGSPRETLARRDIVPTNEVGADTPSSLDALKAMLVWSSDVAAITGRVSPQYAGYVTLQAALKMRDQAELALRAAAGLPTDASVASAGTSASGDIYDFASVLIGIAGIDAPFEGHVAYRVSPALIGLEHRVWLGEDGAPKVADAYDIMASGFRTVMPPHDPVAARSALYLALLETALESELAKTRAAELNSIGVASARTSSAADALAAAVAAGTHFAVLEPGASGLEMLDRLAVGADLKAQIGAALTAGELAVVPDDDALSAWWIISPDRGSVIGVTTTGRGEAIVENIELLQIGAGLVSFVGCLLMGDWTKDPGSNQIVACIVAGIGGYLGSGSYTNIHMSGYITIAAAIAALVLYKLLPNAPPNLGGWTH